MHSLAVAIERTYSYRERDGLRCHATSHTWVDDPYSQQTIGNFFNILLTTYICVR